MVFSKALGLASNASSAAIPGVAPATTPSHDIIFKFSNYQIFKFLYED